MAAPPALLPLSDGKEESRSPDDSESRALTATQPDTATAVGDELELEDGDGDGDDEEYNSAEDSDFDINAPAADEEEEEEEGGEEDVGVGVGATGVDEVVESDRPRKRRRISADNADGDGDGEVGVDVGMDAEFDSGDEATIQTGKEKMEKARKRKEKEMGKKKKGGKRKGVRGDEDDGDMDEGDDFEIDDDDDDDVGGEGGFVRTRGMKMRMHEEQQRPLAKADGATVDVDALWEKMKAAGTTPYTPGKEVDGTGAKDKESKAQISSENVTPSTAPQAVPGEETITIKRVYKFAGEVITEEKVVPKDSAEAKLYLSSEEAKKKGKKDTDDSEESGIKIQFRRPLRRYSRFDPNPPDMIKKNWEKNPVGAQQPKGPKLNTVMKSKLDWAEYVDRTGIKDDLDVHSKAKEGYLGRMDFLNRVDAKREEERRNARLKNL
ncbi:swr complex subunit [Onygenales sp. PD_10]|nr:swr complex subunit [Onygenales sp. PD_10]